MGKHPDWFYNYAVRNAQAKHGEKSAERPHHADDGRHAFQLSDLQPQFSRGLADARTDFVYSSRYVWLSSEGPRTMGYGLPAAIGAQAGSPRSLVINIAGEASLLINVKELATLSSIRFPLK